MDLEQQLRRNIRQRLDDLGRTQTDLGKELFPDSTKPGSTVSQYLGTNSQRGMLSGTALRMLEALGAESIEVKWKESAS